MGNVGTTLPGPTSGMGMHVADDTQLKLLTNAGQSNVAVTRKSDIAPGETSRC